MNYEFLEEFIQSEFPNKPYTKDFIHFMHAPSASSPRATSLILPNVELSSDGYPRYVYVTYLSVGYMHVGRLLYRDVLTISPNTGHTGTQSVRVFDRYQASSTNVQQLFQFFGYRVDRNG